MTIADVRRQRRGKTILDMEGLAASAATLFVGIAEDEARLQLLLPHLKFGAEDEERRLRIALRGHAMLLHNLVHGLLLIGIFEGVAEPRAALAAHADADAKGGLAAVGQKLLHPLRRGFGQ